MKKPNLKLITLPVGIWILILFGCNQKPATADVEMEAGRSIPHLKKQGQSTQLIVGILKNEEGRFENNQWKIIRHLNGDQTHQGRHCRIFRGDYSIQRLALYDY